METAGLVMLQDFLLWTAVFGKAADSKGKRGGNFHGTQRDPELWRRFPQALWTGFPHGRHARCSCTGPWDDLSRAPKGASPAHPTPSRAWATVPRPPTPDSPGISRVRGSGPLSSGAGRARHTGLVETPTAP